MAGGCPSPISPASRRGRRAAREDASPRWRTPSSRPTPISSARSSPGPRRGRPRSTSSAAAPSAASADRPGASACSTCPTSPASSPTSPKSWCCRPTPAPRSARSSGRWRNATSSSPSSRPTTARCSAPGRAPAASAAPSPATCPGRGACAPAPRATTCSAPRRSPAAASASRAAAKWSRTSPATICASCWPAPTARWRRSTRSRSRSCRRPTRPARCWRWGSTTTTRSRCSGRPRARASSSRASRICPPTSPRRRVSRVSPRPAWP